MTQPETPDKRDGYQWFLQQVSKAKRVGQFTVRATLTPEMAAGIIGSHMPAGSNRSARPTKIAKLARVIRAGRWDPNTHQGIAFTLDGIVNDGQHRIRACVAAEAPIELLMTFGQPRSAFEVIDQDINPRSAADLLQLDGLDLNSATTAAAVARGVVMVEKVRAGTIPSEAVRYSHRYEVLEFAREHEETLRRAVSLGRSVAKGIKSRVSSANIGTAIYIILEAGARDEKVAEFCEALSTGASLAANSPILACREGLRNGKFGSQFNAQQDRRIYEIAAIVKAYSLWRMGRTATNAKPLAMADGRTFPKVTP